MTEICNICKERYCEQEVDWCKKCEKPVCIYDSDPLCRICYNKMSQQIKNLQKSIQEIMFNPYMLNCQAIIVETYQKNGVEDLDYFKEI